MNENLIIGLTSPFGSGCTTIAKILEEDKEEKWERFSLSDILKEKLTGDKNDIRGKLQDLGNEMRKQDIEDDKNGGILMRDAFSRLKDKIYKKDIVIECIKNPGEIIELKNKLNAYVIAINSSFDIRWKRLEKKEHYKYEDFKIHAERDKNENLCISRNGKLFSYGQEVQKCFDFADIVINNDKNYEDEDKIKFELNKKIKYYISLLRNPGQGFPSYNELLMNNAYCTSLLSKCLKRQVGAIIVINDRYVISSGYNTVPKGEDDCYIEYAGKCFRDKRINEIFANINCCPLCGNKMIRNDKNINIRCPNKDCEYYKFPQKLKEDIILGKGLDICRALHAEERAILQSSYLGGGISLENASLFTTTFPCMLCAKKIIEVGIKKVVYVEPYPMVKAKEMLEKNDVQIKEFEGVKAQAFYRLFKKYNI